MKRLLCSVVLVLAMAAFAWPFQISAVLTHNAVVVAASGTGTSSAIDLRSIASTGLFALHYTIAGSGTATVAFSQSSTYDGTYVTGATAIATGKTAGTYYTAFAPPISPWMKILVTETGGSQNIIVTIRLVVQ